MFSGIIQNLGTVSFNKKYRIGILSPRNKLRKGDSIAINGVCLTIVKKETKGNKQILHFDVSAETRSKTTMDALTPGSLVNLEPALKASDALNGHIVQGHIDGRGKITRIMKKGQDCIIWFSAPKTVLPYLVSKGSIAVEGISLTVVDIKNAEFSVALIPFTMSHTNLGSLKVGDAVNLEADVLAKYVHKYTKRK